MTFALATVLLASHPTPVVEFGGRYYRLDRVAPALLDKMPHRGLMSLFSDWPAAEQLLQQLCDASSLPSDAEVAPRPHDFMTPLQFPSKVVLGGANYYEHMAVDAKKPDFRKEDGVPVFFLKPPTTSLVGCGPTVRYPVQTNCLDWEIELAVVIGTHLRRASEEQVQAAIAGYAVGIDLSARDLQMNARHPWKFDLFAGKAFDDSCPLGPKVVPARFVDPSNLTLELKVNGVRRQFAHTSDMIWPVTEQIALLSEHVTLEPGDIVLTGTPAGVGMSSDTYLLPGDLLEATISGLGTLSVSIVPDTRASRPAAG